MTVIGREARIYYFSWGGLPGAQDPPFGLKKPLGGRFFRTRARRRRTRGALRPFRGILVGGGRLRHTLGARRPENSPIPNIDVLRGPGPPGY